jgi:hypothetical protein
MDKQLVAIASISAVLIAAAYLSRQGEKRHAARTRASVSARIRKDIMLRPEMREFIRDAREMRELVRGR